MNLKSENVDVVMDPDGDLVLRVGTEMDSDPDASPRNFRVDSGTLRRMSPVFKVMLFGGWAESKPKDGSEWIVTLPEDKPTGLEAVFASSHSRYELLPERPMNGTLLLDILTVCDKYQMIDVIFPWLGCWMRDVDDNRKCYCDGADMAKIAWLSGDETKLRSEVGRLIMRTRISKSAASLVLDFGPGVDELPWEVVIDDLGFGSSDWNGNYYESCCCDAREQILTAMKTELVAVSRLSVIRDILSFVRNRIERPPPDGWGGRTSLCLSEHPSCDDAISGDKPWPGQGLENVDKNKSAFTAIWHMLEYYGADATLLDTDITPIGLINVFRRAFLHFEAPEDHRECSPSARFESFVADSSWIENVGDQLLRKTDKIHMSDIQERTKIIKRRHWESQSQEDLGEETERTQARNHFKPAWVTNCCYRCYSMGF